jgi:hypothetical protein
MMNVNARLLHSSVSTKIIAISDFPNRWLDIFHFGVGRRQDWIFACLYLKVISWVKQFLHAGQEFLDASQPFSTLVRMDVPCNYKWSGW